MTTNLLIGLFHIRERLIAEGRWPTPPVGAEQPRSSTAGGVARVAPRPSFSEPGRAAEPARAQLPEVQRV